MDARFTRYSVFYFFYYAALGAYAPYVGRWLDASGHGGYVVGAMMAMWYASRMVGPPLWAALMQRSAVPGYWFVAATLLTTLAFAGFLLASQVTTLLLVMAVFGTFYNALLPQFEAMTLTALAARSTEYGRIRLWGSVGFLLVAATLGGVLDRIGNEAFPLVTLTLLLMMVIAAWPHRHDRPSLHLADAGAVGPWWRRPDLRRLLLVALLMQVSFGAFYVFYTLHLQARGHSGLVIGALWGLGVLVEIAMFWRVPGWIERFGAERLMRWCLALTVARWLLTAECADSVAVLGAAQLLHAFGFAAFHASCMRQLVDYFPGRRANRGQSLLYAFSSGLGGVLGAALAATMWQIGGGRAAFLASALVAALAWWMLRSGTASRSLIAA
ncbi:MAG: MFS transporter [Lysobacterales bacterium CG02_land_8_20_14_3_00_62_12]|nr:MAG: MFS transporter [Xanthomonadales bacterium CG02_land_8_20_14_3_00_62_12]